MGIEKKFKLNDELYTFLLEKRAGAQIQKASNMPDKEVIDNAEADVLPVKPKKILAFFPAMIAGFGIQLFWVWIDEEFNNKMKEDEDIKKITDIPFDGQIPQYQQKKILQYLMKHIRMWRGFPLFKVENAILHKRN